MAAASISQFLTLFAWFPLSLVLLLLLLIARYYQRISGEPTYFRWYLLPIIGFGGAMLRYASLNVLMGDVLADGLFIASGLTLVALATLLYRRMLAGRT